MREFVYFSNKAVTSGKYLSGNLMHAGRMDIAIHVLINSLFLSHKIREKTKIHLIFNGPPNPPQHLIIFPDGKKSSGKIQLSKKDVAGLIKRMLYKYKQGRRTEAFESCFIEKNSLIKVVEELAKTRNIYLLDRNGESIRNIEIKENPVFILGDHEGINKKELKRISKSAKKISLGKINYFSSQAVTILQNELDNRGIE